MEVAQSGFVGSEFYLFLSHIAKHKVFAHELTEALELYGVEAFVAHDHIDPGRHWQSEIEKALMRCDALAALHHPGFRDSQWCEQEVGWVLGRDLPVVPIRLGEDPGGFEGQVQAISGADGKVAQTYASEILSVLLNEPRSETRLLEAMVARLANSNSFDMSNAIIRFWKANEIELIGSHARTLAKAGQDNRQLRMATAWERSLYPEILRMFGDDL